MLPYTTSWCQDLWFAAQSYRFKERCIQLLKEHKVAALKSFFFLQGEFKGHRHFLRINMLRSSLYLGFDEVPCPVSWIDS